MYVGISGELLIFVRFAVLFVLIRVNLYDSQSMFIGEYSHNLDEKGRLAVPKKFRQVLSKGAVVTRGLDNCLFLYTRSEWTKLAEKLADLPFAQANTRAFARLMLAGAMDVQIDKQGRVVIPEYLRTFAGLKKEIVVAGLYNRLELWDQGTWESYTKKNEKDSTKIAEQMNELGL
jgi:MraZ protein